MIYILIALIFLSKVSLAFLPGMPRELGPLIFQSGLHPYVNIALTGLIGGLVILQWLWKGQQVHRQSRFFRFLLFLFCLYLLFITLLQAQFVNFDESILMQVAAATMSIFTVFLFGRVIPTSLEPELFIRWINKLIIPLCWISLIALLFFPATSFKGNRFIGIFKHIPHMVSVATIGCFALMYPLFYQNLSRKKRWLTILHFCLCFMLLLLTGTRSSLAAVLMGLALAMLVFPTRNNATKMLKFTLAISGLLVMMFFGQKITDYAVGIATGQQGLGSRLAQDGVASRWEEVERGCEIFQKNPWLGQGLLSKFTSGRDTDVANYDANKDPHNIIISAGVIGGWGMIVLAVIGFVGLFAASAITLRSKNAALRLLAIYCVTHMPILFIYHMHLSIGGIADRIYWIIFGYMALKEMDVKPVSPI